MWQQLQLMHVMLGKLHQTCRMSITMSCGLQKASNQPELRWTQPTSLTNPWSHTESAANGLSWHELRFIQVATQTKAWSHIELLGCAAAELLRCQSQWHSRHVAGVVGQPDTGKHHHACIWTWVCLCPAMHHLAIRRTLKGLMCRSM